MVSRGGMYNQARLLPRWPLYPRARLQARQLADQEVYHRSLGLRRPGATSSSARALVSRSDGSGCHDRGLTAASCLLPGRLASEGASVRCRDRLDAYFSSLAPVVDEARPPSGVVGKGALRGPSTRKGSGRRVAGGRQAGEPPAAARILQPSPSPPICICSCSPSRLKPPSRDLARAVHLHH